MTCSGPYYTLVWHLVTDQFPDHLGLSQPEDESSSSPPLLILRSELRVTLYLMVGNVWLALVWGFYIDVSSEVLCMLCSTACSTP